MKEHKCRWH